MSPNVALIVKRFESSSTSPNPPAASLQSTFQQRAVTDPQPVASSQVSELSFRPRSQSVEGQTHASLPVRTTLCVPMVFQQEIGSESSEIEDEENQERSRYSDQIATRDFAMEANNFAKSTVHVAIPHHPRHPRSARCATPKPTTMLMLVGSQKTPRSDLSMSSLKTETEKTAEEAKNSTACNEGEDWAEFDFRSYYTNALAEVRERRARWKASKNAERMPSGRPVAYTMRTPHSHNYKDGVEQPTYNTESLCMPKSPTRLDVLNHVPNKAQLAGHEGSKERTTQIHPSAIDMVVPDHPPEDFKTTPAYIPLPSTPARRAETPTTPIRRMPRVSRVRTIPLTIDTRVAAPPTPTLLRSSRFSEHLQQHEHGHLPRHSAELIRRLSSHSHNSRMKCVSPRVPPVDQATEFDLFPSSIPEEMIIAKPGPQTHVREDAVLPRSQSPPGNTDVAPNSPSAFSYIGPPSPTPYSSANAISNTCPFHTDANHRHPTPVSGRQIAIQEILDALPHVIPQNEEHARDPERLVNCKRLQEQERFLFTSEMIGNKKAQADHKLDCTSVQTYQPSGFMRNAYPCDEQVTRQAYPQLSRATGLPHKAQRQAAKQRLRDRQIPARPNVFPTGSSGRSRASRLEPSPSMLLLHQRRLEAQRAARHRRNTKLPCPWYKRLFCRCCPLRPDSDDFTRRVPAAVILATSESVMRLSRKGMGKGKIRKNRKKNGDRVLRSGREN